MIPLEKKNIEQIQITQSISVTQSNKKRKRSDHVNESPINRRQTRSRSRFLRKITKNIKQIHNTLSSKENDWNIRCDAMKMLSQLYQIPLDITQKIRFRMTQAELKEFLLPLVPALQLQLTDGRSLIIKQICDTIGLIATALEGPLFNEIGVPFLDDLLKLTSNSKIAMSKPAVDCLALIFSLPSPSLLLLRTMFPKINTFKNPMIIRQCVTCIRMAISSWTLKDLFVFIEPIQECILSTATAADSAVRAESREAFAALASRRSAKTQSDSPTPLTTQIMTIFMTLESREQRRIQQDYPELGFGKDIAPLKKKVHGIKGKKHSKKIKTKLKKKKSNLQEFLKAQRKKAKSNHH